MEKPSGEDSRNENVRIRLEIINLWEFCLALIGGIAIIILFVLSFGVILLILGKNAQFAAVNPDISMEVALIGSISASVAGLAGMHLILRRSQTRCNQMIQVFKEAVKSEDAKLISAIKRLFNE